MILYELGHQLSLILLNIIGLTIQLAYIFLKVGSKADRF
jgi:hypothetical protein